MCAWGFKLLRLKGLSLVEVGKSVRPCAILYNSYTKFHLLSPGSKSDATYRHRWRYLHLDKTAYTAFLALVQIIFMWVVQDRSEVIKMPKYLNLVTLLSGNPFRLIVAGNSFTLFRDTSMYLHLLA